MRLAAAAILTLLPLAAAKWNVSYQYDMDDASLFLRAIEFPSDQRGIAIGILNEKGRTRPVALVTSNGGKSWDHVRLKDDPLSVACFTDEVCWISTDNGVWRSDEGGRDWKKISSTKFIMKMQFLSVTHGFAAGANKSAWETIDGGKTWTLLPVLKEVKATAQYAGFMAVAIQGNIGFIAGNSRAPRRDNSIYPDWMVPDEVAKRREFPGMMLLLETRDGGKNWAQSTNSVFGTLTALRIRPEGGSAAALLEYFHTFETPSEVLLIDFKNGKSKSIFRDKTMAATDLLALSGNSFVLAAIDNTSLRTLPIPQKVRILEATIHDSQTNVLWTKMDVDYRVTARRVHLARKPNGQLWAATDSGFILRLDRDVKAVEPKP